MQDSWPQAIRLPHQTPESPPTASLITDHSITNGSSVDSNSGIGSELLLKIITKDTGQPVPNVSVGSISYRGGFPTSFTQFNTISTRLGEARIRFASDAKRVEINTISEGFANTRLRWHPDKGQKIPDTYTLRLERGVMIGGRVIDPDGNPVAGAHVHLHSAQTERGATGIESQELSYTFISTGEDGRWQTRRIAEAVLNRCALSASAEGFQPSEHERLDEHPELLDPLRAQTHVLKLTRGITVSGVVVTGTNEPVADARVILVPFDVRKLETRTSKDGSFQFTNVSPYSMDIAAKAEGYPPSATRIESGGKTDGVRLVLAKGETVRMRLVDRQGEPVSRATVIPDRIGSVVLNISPVDMPPSERKSPDQDGRLVWHDAPPGTNWVRIEADGFLHEDHVPVVADGLEHVVVLAPAPVIQGHITDADTGDPLPAFSVFLGQENHSGAGDDPDFFSFPSDLTRINFTGGRFRHEITRRIAIIRTPGVPIDTFLVRFEADGYKSKLSRPVRYDEGVVTLDAALKRSPDIEVTVIDPSGREASSAEAALVKSPGRCTVKDGCFLQPLETNRRADARGKLTLTKEPGVRRIVMTHPSGYLETSFEALQADPVARLQPWGRVEGEVVSRSPGSGAVRVSLVPEDDSEEFTFEISADTDAQGRFTLSKVPPGNRLVRWSRPFTSNLPTALDLIPCRATKVVIRPGGTTRLKLGGGGHVTGRIRLPDDPEVDGQALRRGFALLIPPLPPPSDLFRIVPELRREHSPVLHAALRGAEYSTARMNDNGAFTFDSVAPGSYRLITVFDKWELAQYVTGLEIHIPEQPGAGEIDLGEVTATAVSR